MFLHKGSNTARKRTFNFCDTYSLTLLGWNIRMPGLWRLYGINLKQAFMKHFGSILDFTHERNRDIMRVYRERLAEATVIVMPAIFELVAQSPASRFWVSEERAAAVVAAMEAGKPMPRMRSNKREMFGEIYRRYLIMRKDCPGKSAYELVARIVNQPAPKFYLTPRTVGEFIYRIRNGWYDNQYDRYRDCRAACGE